MMDITQVRVDRSSYRNIFIVENMNLWKDCASQCSREADLILCLDFGLMHHLKEEGYSVAFLDHIVQNEVLQFYNFQMHDFLQNWYKDEKGNDLLSYKGFQIGDALLLNILNEVTYFCHFFFNISAIKKINYTGFYVAVEDIVIEDVIQKVGLDYTRICNINNKKESPVFSFPISKWMKERIQRTSLKHKLKDFVTSFFDMTLEIIDRIRIAVPKRIFIQNYHPTNTIIELLNKDSSIQLIFSNYTGLKKIIQQRRIFYKNKKYTIEANELFINFKNAKKRKWEIDEHKLSDFIYEKLMPIIQENIEPAISKIASIKKYFDKYPIQLMVPITNLWLENRLIMNYCRNNQVPVFMIINGLLNVPFYRDAHDSDWVNCYSETIKNDYFKNAFNALPLGDPRMDYYALAEKKHIERVNPTIVIGAAGFDVIDLNSYLAYEFDFVYDILKTISALKSNGYNSNIIIKVRGNGYEDLYKAFVERFFSEMKIEIIQNVPFNEVIIKADLYLSFYSQTIIEASCLGIPVIYYKKDTQTIDRPFDGKSELVTAFNLDELKAKLISFYEDSDEYKPFMEIAVMEKYIGPLDGNNLKRNIDFIYKLLNKSE